MAALHHAPQLHYFNPEVRYPTASRWEAVGIVEGVEVRRVLTAGEELDIVLIDVLLGITTDPAKIDRLLDERRRITHA